MVKDFVKRHWWTGLVAVVLVPFFTFQAMHERKAREAAQEASRDAVVDPRVPEVKLRPTPDGFAVVYADGRVVPADGIGVAVLTAADAARAKEVLAAVGPQPVAADYPLVVFFNRSGFDATGKPVAVRRAADAGKVAWDSLPPGRVRALVPNATGYTAYFFSGEPAQVDADEFERYYLNEPPPAAGKAEKKEEEQAAPEAKPKAEPAAKVPAPPEVPQGLRGAVYEVGGAAALKPLAADVIAFPGKAAPDGKGGAKGDPVGTKAQADAGGKYRLPLPPGEYTVVVVVDGKFYGNALNQTAWPSVTVAAGEWREYDVRKVR
jgi:hypothetical protein